MIHQKAINNGYKHSQLKYGKFFFDETEKKLPQQNRI